METRLLKSREILNDFLDRWPLNTVKKMALSDYVDTGNPDTFCQWVETKTKDLGSIKGHFSNKFGIYKRKEKNKKPSTLNSDDTYTWQPYYGSSRDEAFEKVKHEIVQIITFSKEGDFSKLDQIHLNNLMKWKISFLYSGEKIVPIFKKGVLIQIAEDQGLIDAKNKEISQLQEFIYGNKPVDLNIYQYASILYGKHGSEEDSKPSYYIVGSKYGENAEKDMLPLMEEFNVVSTGFAWGYDLAHLYRSKPKEIVQELKEIGEPNRSYNILRHFLQLKPGDLIAVKSSGAPKTGKPFLEIVAYAVVVDREGIVYNHDTKNLGHCINVEFIKTDIKNQFELGGYGRTIHKIEDKTLINTIFGEYSKEDSNLARKDIKNRRRKRSGVKSKSTIGQRRKGSRPYVTNPKHNKIQILFKEHLESEYGKENVILEENNVDIKLIENGHITYYEVKPYDWAEDCIRAGIGQLLSYTFFDSDEKSKSITIVGPYPPEVEEEKFIEFLKRNLNIEFNYEYFEIE